MVVGLPTVWVGVVVLTVVGVAVLAGVSVLVSGPTVGVAVGVLALVVGVAVSHRVWMHVLVKTASVRVNSISAVVGVLSRAGLCVDVLHPAVLVGVLGTVVLVPVEVVRLGVDVISVTVNVGVVRLAAVVSVGARWGFTHNLVGVLLGLAVRVRVWSVYNDYFLGNHHLIIVVICDVVVWSRVVVVRSHDV